MDETAVGREQARALGEALRRAGIELNWLWLQSFRLGGELSEFEIEAYLHHALDLPPYQRDLLAQAANNLIDQLPPLRAPYSCELREPRSGA
jgi:hypothetical protein